MLVFVFRLALDVYVEMAEVAEKPVVNSEKQTEVVGSKPTVTSEKPNDKTQKPEDKSIISEPKPNLTTPAVAGVESPALDTHVSGHGEVGKNQSKGNATSQEGRTEGSGIGQKKADDKKKKQKGQSGGSESQKKSPDKSATARNGRSDEKSEGKKKKRKGRKNSGETQDENGKKQPGVSAGKQTERTTAAPSTVRMQSSTAERFRENDKRRTSLISEFMDFIHKTAVGAGFEYSGRQYMRCKANFFESVKLLPLYDKHLKDCMPRACPLERSRLRQKLLLTRSLAPSVDFLAGIISGVPGSGKSSLVRKFLTGKFTAVCALANPALEKDYSGITGVYKIEDLLLSAVPITSDILIVDEYTLAESAEILLLQRRLRATMVVLVGDVAQGTATNASSIEYLTLPVIYSKTTSHRIGEKTAELCAKQGNRIRSEKKSQDRVVITDYEGETDATEKNISFTKDTQDDLKELGIDSSLVKDVQGLEYDSVTLFMRDADRKEVANKHLRLVALTRHKSKLVIRAESEIRQAFLTGDLEVSANKASNAHCYANKPDENSSWFSAK